MHMCLYCASCLMPKKGQFSVAPTFLDLFASHHSGFIVLSLCHLLERGQCLSHSNAGATPVLYLEGSLCICSIV